MDRAIVAADAAGSLQSAKPIEGCHIVGGYGLRSAARRAQATTLSKDITPPARERIQPNEISKRAARVRRFLSRVQSRASEVSSTDPSNSRSMAPQPES